MAISKLRDTCFVLSLCVSWIGTDQGGGDTTIKLSWPICKKCQLTNPTNCWGSMRIVFSIDIVTRKTRSVFLLVRYFLIILRFDLCLKKRRNP